MTAVLSGLLELDGIVVDSQTDDEGERCVGITSAEEAAQPAQVDSSLGTNAGTESTLPLTSLAQGVCTVEARCSGFGTMSQAETSGPVAGDPREIAHTSDAFSIDIRGPPQDDEGSFADQNAPARDVKRQIVFVDPSVPDSEVLVAGLLPACGPEARVVYLDADRDGFRQIGEVLRSYTEISAIHILSHGSSGSLTLGSTHLGADNVDIYASQLSLWGSVLTEDADILLYGCDVASGESGLRLVENLSLLTGADVAASDDPTGQPALGGDWELEYSSGMIETSPLFGRSVVCDYGFLLGAVTISGTLYGDSVILDTDAVTVNVSPPQTVNSADDLTVDGLAGDDNANILDGGGGMDTLIGGGGDDTYSPGHDFGIDSIVENAGEGSDTLDLSRVSLDLVFSIHASGSVSVTDGTNSINNAPGIENLIGGSGRSTFAFEDGASLEGTIDGGTGPSNTLDYSQNTSGVAVNLGAGSAEGTLGVENIHNIIGGSGNDTLIGDGKDNAIDGGPGNDILNGGGGADTVDYGSASGGAGNDTLSNFENIIGSAHGDTLTGDNDANVIQGGPGNDTLDGGGGSDTVDYSSAGSGVTVNLLAGSASGGNGDDTLSNFENILGSPFADVLTGDDNANVIDGGAGNDTYRLAGHWGTDTITELAGGGVDALVILGNPAEDVFSVGSGLVERRDSATLPVTDSVSYGNTIESLSIHAGAGEMDQILFVQTLIFDQTASFRGSNISFSQNVFAPGGIIANAGKSIEVADNVTLSTRQISGSDHENGISTGDSGDIIFNAPSVTVSEGAKLLAHVEAASLYAPGMITLTAEAESDWFENLPILHIEDISSTITLSGATIKGGTVTIEALADTNTEFGDIENAGDVASFVLEFIGQFSTIGGLSSSKALAEVDIQTGTTIEAVDAVIKAEAKTEAKIRTLSTALGISYGYSAPTARVYVRDGATITATGDLDITTKADSTMRISAYALTLGPQMGFSVDVTAAVSRATIESTRPGLPRCDAQCRRQSCCPGGDGQEPQHFRLRRGLCSREPGSGRGGLLVHKQRERVGGRDGDGGRICHDQSLF